MISQALKFQNLLKNTVNNNTSQRTTFIQILTPDLLKETAQISENQLFLTLQYKNDFESIFYPFPATLYENYEGIQQILKYMINDYKQQLQIQQKTEQIVTNLQQQCQQFQQQINKYQMQIETLSLKKRKYKDKTRLAIEEINKLNELLQEKQLLLDKLMSSNKMRQQAQQMQQQHQIQQQPVKKQVTTRVLQRNSSFSSFSSQSQQNQKIKQNVQKRHQQHYNSTITESSDQSINKKADISAMTTSSVTSKKSINSNKSYKARNSSTNQKMQAIDQRLAILQNLLNKINK